MSRRHVADFSTSNRLNVPQTNHIKTRGAIPSVGGMLFSSPIAKMIADRKQERKENHRQRLDGAGSKQAILQVTSLLEFDL